MIPQIKSMEPKDGFKLLVAFDEGRRVVYNVADDIRDIEAFKELEILPGLFGNARLDSSRTFVVWNERWIFRVTRSTNMAFLFEKFLRDRMVGARVPRDRMGSRFPAAGDAQSYQPQPPTISSHWRADAWAGCHFACTLFFFHTSCHGEGSNAKTGSATPSGFKREKGVSDAEGSGPRSFLGAQRTRTIRKG